MDGKDELQLTPATARALGISTQTLMRYRDDRGGFLAAGVDYYYGANENSPIRWDAKSCIRQIHQRGKLIRKATELIAGQKK